MRTDPPPPTKMPRWPSGKRKECRFIGDPDVRGRSNFEPAADGRAFQGCHEGNMPAGHANPASDASGRGCSAALPMER